ncbi:autophagy-related protein 22-like protein [Gorgonomyces haynaldii]|nr:autophagy-related protein 22-like protein [Gorgonomyces haynaldii]
MTAAKVDAYESSPVTIAELRGWYSYGVAVEGYLILGLAIFFPILLEGLASAVAVETHNYALPCDTSVAGYDCSVQIGGSHVPTSSLVFWSSAISTIIQFFLYLSVSSFADYGSLRRSMTLLFGYLTCAGGILLLVVTSAQLWWLAFLIFIFTGITFGTSFVFATSYLPILTRYSPEVLAISESGDKQEMTRVSEKVGNTLSAKMAIYSNAAAVVLLILGAGFSIVVDSSVWSKMGLTPYYGLVISIAFSALWATVVLIGYTHRRLSDRKGPPLPQSGSTMLFSIRKFYVTFKKARKLPQLFKFLIAYFLYSDGFNTIASTAILYAQVQLLAPQQLLLITGVAVPIASVIGIALFTWIQQKLGWTTKTVLLIQGFLYILLPIYGLLFFNTQAELIPIACYHGAVLGATQSTLRVLFSELVPPGNEAEFFGLYSVTDKGAAWIGPFIVGAIRNSTGNLKPTFWFLLSQLTVPFVIFLTLNMQQGKEQAVQFSKIIQEDDKQEIEMQTKK